MVHDYIDQAYEVKLNQSQIKLGFYVLNEVELPYKNILNEPMESTYFCFIDLPYRHRKTRTRILCY